MAPRLTSGFWVKAYIRTCQTRGIPAFVARRGAEEAGGIFVTVNLLNGQARVLAPFSGAEEGRAWYWGTGDAPVAESDAAAFLDRQSRVDEDIWVVEIEDREGRHFLDDDIKAMPGSGPLPG